MSGVEVPIKRILCLHCNRDLELDITGNSGTGHITVMFKCTKHGTVDPTNPKLYRQLYMSRAVE